MVILSLDKPEAMAGDISYLKLINFHTGLFSRGPKNEFHNINFPKTVMFRYLTRIFFL